MGGDHKCPVCQATFTRPQHVARHMRSHTGDRPYKCQYCGDQFARSDLLARHINKCHANEKPPTSATSGGRRKGSAATSRATTSKQACDQCVQSTLPCDGCNPCAKCVSRKCRCTYVKFHRQTAPSGPGHHPPRSSSSSSSLNGSIASSRLSSHLDDFVLAPPPAAPSAPAPFSDPDQIFDTPFALNTTAPLYPPNWTTTDISHLPFSIPSDTDMAAKFHAQAEFLRRAAPPVLSSTSSTVLPSMYATQQHPSPSTHWHPAWGESASFHPLDDTKSFDGVARAHSLTSSEPPSFAPELYAAGFIGPAHPQRRTSLDFSDSSSATSHSVPSSASSSSVHLPLSANELYDARSEEIQRRSHDAHTIQHQRRRSIPTSQPPSFPGPSETCQPPPQAHHVGEGGFSSAFGLMSIDDPNVLAGLSSDGVPFFSHLGMGILPHSPNSTPMPTRVQHHHPHQGRDRGMSLSALPPSRSSKDAADTRELKDVWKTYMRSPLSGPGTASLGPSTLQPSSHAQVPQSPSAQRRRMRVSSLPSVTPTVEKDHPLMENGHGDVGTVRTTMHGNPEDLRRYEAAVNARNASLNFNLVPRRRGTRPSLNEGSGMGNVGVAAGVARLDHPAISRPSSSSSLSSSLAQALAVPSSQQQHPYPLSHAHAHAHVSASGVVKPPPMQGASISLPIPPSMSMTGLHSHSNAHFGSSTSLTFEPGSRASSVTSDGTGTGGSGSDGEAFRPSFKRYPSQTLGPASSKRAMVERKGEKLKGKDREGEEEGGEGAVVVMMVEVEGSEEADMEGTEVGVGVGAAGSPRSRPIAGLPERAKRA